MIRTQIEHEIDVLCNMIRGIGNYKLSNEEIIKSCLEQKYHKLKSSIIGSKEKTC